MALLHRVAALVLLVMAALAHANDFEDHEGEGQDLAQFFQQFHLEDGPQPHAEPGPSSRSPPPQYGSRPAHGGHSAPVPAPGHHGDAPYKRLHKKLLSCFSLALPMQEDGHPVVVDLRMTLRQILDVNKENHRVTLLAWKEEAWYDPTLAWDPAHYSNISSVGIRATNLWYPDTVPYNLVSKNEFITPPTVVVLHTGQVVSVQAIKFSIDCDTDGYDTYSGAVCTLKMGSWTYNGNLVTFREPTDDSFVVSEFSRVSRYELLPENWACSRTVHKYPCCPEPYETLSFTFHFRLKGRKDGRH